MTPKEALDQHVHPDLTDRWGQLVLDAVLTAITTYHEQQVNSVDLGGVGGSYRMLKEGERIQAGDEFIDNNLNWKMSNSCGEIFTHEDYHPHRRLK